MTRQIRARKKGELPVRREGASNANAIQSSRSLARRSLILFSARFSLDVENGRADAGWGGQNHLVRPNSQARTGAGENPFPCLADHIQELAAIILTPHLPNVMAVHTYTYMHTDMMAIHTYT